MEHVWKIFSRNRISLFVSHEFARGRSSERKDIIHVKSTLRRHDVRRRKDGIFRFSTNSSSPSKCQTIFTGDRTALGIIQRHHEKKKKKRSLRSIFTSNFTQTFEYFLNPCLNTCRYSFSFFPNCIVERTLSLQLV